MSGLAPTRTVPTKTLWAIRLGTTYLQGYKTREEAEEDLACWQERLPNITDTEVLAYHCPDWEALGIGGHDRKEGRQ